MLFRVVGRLEGRPRSSEVVDGPRALERVAQFRREGCEEIAVIDAETGEHFLSEDTIPGFGGVQGRRK